MYILMRGYDRFDQVSKYVKYWCTHIYTQGRGVVKPPFPLLGKLWDATRGWLVGKVFWTRYLSPLRSLPSHLLAEVTSL